MRIILGIACLVSLPLFSATKVLMPTENLPKELIYLTESLQELNLKNIEKTKDNDQSFTDLEKKLQYLTKQEVYFLVKSEMYKSVLSFKPPAKIKDMYYQKEILALVEERLKTVSLNSFSQWLITSILKDLNILFESKHYPSFTLERGKGVVTSSSSKKMQKKFNFLLPWIQSFLDEEAQLFQYSLIPVMEKSLSSINKKIGYLISFSEKSTSEETKDGVKYFKEQVIQLDKAGKAISVEDILNPLIGKLKNKNLPVPVDDWLESEDDFATGLTPVQIQKPSGNYIAPKKLPKPVEGW